MSAATGTTHPLFDSVSIFSRSPLGEIDYNLHKSNCTYFSDLDESRTALMTKLAQPAWNKGNAELEKEGYKGKLTVNLGSVHTTFHREIKPYERYEIRSRLLGWNEKWVVILSCFIRPATKGKGEKGGRPEFLLASSLSKYVVKKNRFTVPPQRFLHTAGWLPDKPATAPTHVHRQKGSESSGTTSTPSSQAHQDPAPEPPTPQTPNDTPGLVAPIPEPALESAHVINNLEKAASDLLPTSQTQPTENQPVAADSIATATTPPRAVEWDWHRIEMERLRGLQIAEAWLGLDKALMGEFAHRQPCQ